jgi:hypothetical protein
MSRRQSLWLLFVALGIVGLAALPLLFRVADGIITNLLLGHNQSPPPKGTGPLYAPLATGAATIDGVDYRYIATADREAQIIAGFKKLKVGQSREEVRDAMGPPDSAEPMHRKAHNMPFIGWSYTYEVKMRSRGPNMNDVSVQIFFDADGSLHWAAPNHILGLEDVGGYRKR